VGCVLLRLFCRKLAGRQTEAPSDIEWKNIHRNRHDFRRIGSDKSTAQKLKMPPCTHLKAHKLIHEVELCAFECRRYRWRIRSRSRNAFRAMVTSGPSPLVGARVAGHDFRIELAALLELLEHQLDIGGSQKDEHQCVEDSGACRRRNRTALGLIAIQKGVTNGFTTVAALIHEQIDAREEKQPVRAHYVSQLLATSHSPRLSRGRLAQVSRRSN
jgi:hypothetical protein